MTLEAITKDLSERFAAKYAALIADDDKRILTKPHIVGKAKMSR